MREIDAIDMLHYNESIHFEDLFLKMDPLVEPDPMEWPNDLFALQQVRRTQFGWLLVKQLWPCPRGQLPSCSTPPPLLAVCLGNTMGNECGIGGEGKEEGRTDGRTSDGLRWPDNKAIPFAQPLSCSAVGLRGQCMHTYCMESGTLTSTSKHLCQNSRNRIKSSIIS